MSSEEPLTEREKSYLNRNQRYDYIDNKEDKGKTLISGEVDDTEFPKHLLQTMHDIAREIKEMRMERHK